MALKRVAIIGLGSIGRRHLRLIKEINQDIKIVLVRSGKGKKWPEETMADYVVSSIQGAIELNVQAAIISSPSILHIEQALQLANEGIHLLIEKPLSNSMERVNELHEIAQDNDCIILVGYVLRFDRGARKFKQWLEGDHLGRVLHARIECGSYLPDWRPDQDYQKGVSASKELGGGVLLELSHEIDYLHWFFEKPISVYAMLRNSGILGIDVEDQADLLMKSKESYPLTVQLDFNRRHATRLCNVQSINGELTWNAIQKCVVWRPINGEKVVDYFQDEKDYIYEEQLKNFIASIEHNKKPTVSLLDGIKVMELVEAATVSYKTGKEVLL